jgi:hypothetical protein
MLARDINRGRFVAPANAPPRKWRGSTRQHLRGHTLGFRDLMRIFTDAVLAIPPYDTLASAGRTDAAWPGAAPGARS